MRRLALAAIVLLAPGCALFQTDRPELRIDYGAATLAYADGKATYAVLMRAVGQACNKGALDAETCRHAAITHERVTMLDGLIRDSLRDARGSLDWTKVTDFLAAILGMAVRLAP